MLNDANRVKKTYSVYRAPPTSIVNAMQLKEGGALRATKPYINFVSGTTVSSDGDISMAMQLKTTGSLIATKSFINFVSGTAVSADGDVSLQLQVQEKNTTKYTRTNINFFGGAAVDNTGSIHVPIAKINVKDYPFKASGDGIIDDSLAFSSAISAAINGDTITIPSGTYKLNSPLTVNKNVRFEGEGILLCNSTTWGVQVNATNVEFKGLTFNGNARIPTGNADYDSLIITQPSSSLKLTNCHVKLPSRIGVSVYGSAIVSNCVFDDFPKANVINYSVGAISCFAQTGEEQNLTVTDCQFIMGSSSDSNKEYNGSCVSVTSVTADSTPFRRVIISNNVFKYYGLDYSGGEAGAIDTYNGAADVTVTGNVFYDGGYCACKLQRANRFTVSSNVIAGVSNKTGTKLAFGVLVESNARSGDYPSLAEGTTGTVVGNVIYNVSSSLDCASVHVNSNNCIISNNVIDCNNQTKRGIEVVRGNYVSVLNNTVLNPTIYGIEIIPEDDPIEHVRIDDNTVIANEIGNSAIKVIGDVTNLSVSRNTVQTHASNIHPSIDLVPATLPSLGIPTKIDVVGNRITSDNVCVRCVGTSKILINDNILNRTSGASYATAMNFTGCDANICCVNNVLPEEADCYIDTYDVTARATTDLAHALNHYRYSSPDVDDWAEIFQASAVQILTDGDMEAVGTAAWSALRSTLSKTGDAHAGSQCLQITSDGTSPTAYARQLSVLTIGSTYLVTGWAKSDGTGLPKIGYASKWWEGTTSTSWQYFCFLVVSDHANFGLYTEVDTTVYFDDIGVWAIS